MASKGDSPALYHLNREKKNKLDEGPQHDDSAGQEGGGDDHDGGGLKNIEVTGHQETHELEENGHAEPPRLLLRIQFVDNGDGRENRRDDPRGCEVVAEAETTARAICRTLAELQIPGVKQEAMEHYVLVMVYPTREDDGSLTHILHTLQSEERPLSLVDEVLKRSETEAWGFTREQLLDENLISWFLKDLRAAPLDFRGYVSGSSPSDDEEQAPWSDMHQIGQGYYSGYLLKKSSKDPCLWRRRWCILGEDKIWYMKLKHRKTQGKAAYISLVSNQVLEHPRNSQVQFGIEIHTAHRVYLFRATDRAQQMGWIKAIQARINLSSENDLICMAELMIGDEEQARARRLQQAIEAIWTSSGISSNALEETIRRSPRHSPLEAVSFASTGVSRPGTPLARGGSGRSKGGGKHVLFTRGNDFAEYLAFTMAIQEFKELCRHDLTTNEKKWEAAQRVFDEFLRGRAVEQGPDEQEEEGGDNEERDSQSRKRRTEGLTLSPSTTAGGGIVRLFRPKRMDVNEVESRLLEYGALSQARGLDQPSKFLVKKTLTESIPSVSRLLGGGNRDRGGGGRGTSTEASLPPLEPPPRTLFDRLLEGLQDS